MNLYHRASAACLILFLLAACAGAEATESLLLVKIQVDGEITELSLPAGSTVQQALDRSKIKLGPLDRVEPPVYSQLLEDTSNQAAREPGSGEQALIRVIRVKEDFTVTEETIPFESRVLQTESLPDGEQLLAQSGENGLQEITYRRVYENGIQVSEIPVKWSTVKESAPEVMLVGIRAVFTPLAIPGRLVYLLGKNAWLMEGTTAQRKPLVMTGDLDGRIFTLSADGTSLLFTRKIEGSEGINSLWVALIDADPVKLIDLGVENVVHFADFMPGSGNTEVGFSTVEPRESAPGWQANNDFHVVTYSASGWVKNPWRTILEANFGGVYGWWGTNFSWSTGGDRLAYIRPDEIGLVDLAEGVLQPALKLLPYQTRSDWAWLPGVSWAPDGTALYTINHLATAGSPSPEESQLFDLTALSFTGGVPIPLAAQAGMFAYPAASPVYTAQGAEKIYHLAYLQAIFEAQSENSRYRLVLMDRDGSNRRVLFPDEGELGLQPQPLVWSPAPLSGWGDPTSGTIALVYQGNLWLVQATTGEAQQITGDGLTSRVVWR